MPEFTEEPSAKVVDNGDGTSTREFTWETSIPCTAQFALMNQGIRGDYSTYVPQQDFAEQSEFSYDIVRPSSIVEFYAVKITANEQDSYYYGQMPQ